ncbi:MAG TPA: flagellar biosynthesis protein [Methylibium sp.]|nr:flagellar biosynthesis protein [Methylibium sp.]
MSTRADRHHVLPATDSWFNQLEELPLSEIPPPADQAQGLRRLFAAHTMRCIPIVSNPAIAFGGAMLERLCTVYAEQGLRTLVVDAGERARAPRELARFDLSEGIELLSEQVSYFAARGLPLRYVDASGSTAAFLDAVADAAPDADVVLVHASASDLARLFARRVQEQQATALRPIVLCDEHADSVTHAYGAIKLLATRAGLMAHDLLVSAVPGSKRAALVAERVARCADSFLGAVLHDWVAVDPAEAPTDQPSLALQRLAREQLAVALPQRVSDSAFAALAAAPARSALPAQPQRAPR